MFIENRRHQAMRRKLTDFIFSFPFQLLFLHLRSNLLLLGVWALLTMMMTGNLGGKFGLRYLFLSPEYMGQVDFMSFYYMGVGFGAMVMSWNLTAYLLSANKFSFLASLARPFTKFAINNLIIPLTFTGLFLYYQIRFGLYYEFRQPGEAVWHSVGFLAGFATLVLILILYFSYTNKDIFSLLKSGRYQFDAPPTDPGQPFMPLIEDIKLNRNQWRVDTYLTENLRPRLVRSVAHYDSRLLLRVFRQNHLNALVVQLFTLIILVLLGALMDRPAFRLPTGASIFLLASIIIAIAGALSYWFNQWRITAVLGILFFINFITRFDFFHHKNKAYGLDYQAAPAAYSTGSLEAMCAGPLLDADKAATLEILEKWKVRNTPADGRKPKMVFFCVSGGGLKAAVWTMEVLQAADSVTQAAFFKHTVLISGASGGMMGASYYRELAFRQAMGEKISYRNGIADISRDMLNPVSFTIITNDLFLPWATFEYQGRRYKKDRGYIFEKTLNENTRFRMDKSMGDYAWAERQALLPLVFITPSIINDGRRLIISSQPVRYMMTEPSGMRQGQAVQVDAVDFGQLFAEQHAADLRFTTALRMNATYPYILPNVYLPSEPPVEVLDAGFRDNFGLKSSTRFIHVFKDWIRENTSGVVVVVVRAFDRQKEIDSSKNQGIIETILNPLEIAFKVMSLQDYEHDNNLGFLYDLLGQHQMEIVRFTYHPSESMKDSPISFYLTRREREDLLRAISTEESQAGMNRLKALLK